MRITLATIIFCLMACLVSLSISCAGVRASMKAEHIDVPVSFTPFVYDAAGNAIGEEDYNILKQFVIKKRFWAMLWRNVDLSQNDWDLSKVLNREVSSVDGDAIVNMTVLSKGGWSWCFSSLIPIIPDYHDVIVEGDVIRLKSEVKLK